MSLEAAIGGPAWLTDMLGWIQAHPVEAAIALAIASALEGLFLIGLIIPGAVLMFAAGAVAVAGEIPLAPVLLVAALGAWLGDCLSYYLGWRLRNQLPTIAARLGMPSAIRRGEEFFAKHGGKSIFMGRFIGPLRPLVPAIAGAASMPPVAFVLIDLVAALLWAPAYAIPGVMVGATLGLAAEITSRFALLLGIAFGVVFLLWWFITLCVRLNQRYAEPWLLRTMDWSHKHRRLGNLGPALTDPDQPETPILAASLAAMAVVSGLISLLWWYWPGGEIGPPAIDDTIYDAVASLLSGSTWPVALYLDALGSETLSAIIGVSLLTLFTVLRRTRLAAHWLAALVGGALLGLCLPGSGMAIGPSAVLNSTAGMALSLSLWLCLAGFLATKQRDGVRIALYVGAGLILSLILLAKMMLGAVSFSQLVIGVPLILLWSSLLTLGFRRHLRSQRRLPTARSLLLVCGVTMISFSLYPPQGPAKTEVRWEQAERSPARINLRWMGDGMAIEQSLVDAGWSRMDPTPRRAYVGWLLPGAEEADLPPAPQWLAGRPAEMRFLLRRADTPLIVRLWEDEPNQWLGQVGELKLRRWAGLMRVPVTVRSDKAIEEFLVSQSGQWRAQRTARETSLYVLELK